jgi:hypothetical protein
VVATGLDHRTREERETPKQSNEGNQREPERACGGEHAAVRLTVPTGVQGTALIRIYLACRGIGGGAGQLAPPTKAETRERTMGKNWQTTLTGLLKIAAALFFAYTKISHGQALDAEDMTILAALGLGAAGSVAAADAKQLPPKA